MGERLLSISIRDDLIALDILLYVPFEIAGGCWIWEGRDDMDVKKLLADATYDEEEAEENWGNPEGLNMKTGVRCLNCASLTSAELHYFMFAHDKSLPHREYPAKT